jgi:hypothetical protein
MAGSAKSLIDGSHPSTLASQFDVFSGLSATKQN